MLEYIPYGKTGYFNQLVTDFLAEHPQIRPFYTYSPVRPDFAAAIQARQNFDTPRAALVAALESQYASLDPVKAVRDNIAALLTRYLYGVHRASAQRLHRLSLFRI